ncbi:MAG: prepilin-type N-terminal cleavage/methylation domain-containing protein [Bacilli bacterium]|nr:prepilin-type N-terminal cleavage/methylation domain-containing protein [Bacilli bacterium]
MNKKGFTLIELIAVITLFSIISLLVFGALTGSIKSASVKEMEVYKDNVSRAAQVYVETNLENYTLDSPGKYIVLKGAKIIEAGYLDKSIKNPSSCSIEEVNIRIYMESDYTLSYAVYCDGEEPPLSGDAEPIEPETPVTPETPETPSQTLYVFEYTGSVQEVTLPAGKWKLEVWGAQGGSGRDNNGGAGGYSEGVITLSNSSNIYVYVGGQGATGTGTSVISGGFNGGGDGYTGSNNSGYMGSGGGASDIRVNTDSLYARVIVAGGGGGSGSWSESGYQTQGGAGGGFIGGNCISIAGSSQSLGGGASNIEAGENHGDVIGGFGFGAYSSSGSSSGGGGSGWYGGGAGRSNGSGGGGGSGWIYTADNFSAWQTGNPTDANNWLLNSSYYLTNAETIDGTTPFFDPDGTEVTGHSGNGYAKITWVSN